jgi:hypothetical protein
MAITVKTVYDNAAAGRSSAFPAGTLEDSGNHPACYELGPINW